MKSMPACPSCVVRVDVRRIAAILRICLALLFGFIASTPASAGMNFWTTSGQEMAPIVSLAIDPITTSPDLDPVEGSDRWEGHLTIPAGCRSSGGSVGFRIKSTTGTAANFLFDGIVVY